MILETTALLCLSANIYFEARSEKVDGQIAVAEVTLNRVRSDDYPDDVCSVVLQENSEGCQFSWWCDGKPDIVTDDFAFQRAKAIAELMLRDGDYITVIGNDALHYHTLEVSPYWKDNYEFINIVGNHVFYRNFSGKPLPRPDNFEQLIKKEEENGNERRESLEILSK
tara:strand:+ start:871 stop:1374 length:504 start_codon:yes stop_codon:yes gene_type:complete